MRVFLVAGEPSGDLHGARLAEALRALDPTITLRGVGGPRMRALGLPLWAASDHWGAMGIPEALRKAAGLYLTLQRLAAHLRREPPDVLVLIDFGAFNVMLLKQVRAHVPRALYYIPPGCWDRTRPAGALPFLVDAIATPFSWSAENLRAAGAPARVAWVGHPLLDYCRPTVTRAQARTVLGVRDGEPVLALAPGSRDAEIRDILPAFYAAAAQLTPTPHCLLAVAPNQDARRLLRLAPPGLRVTAMPGLDYDRLPAADAALVASGTAALELAILGLPMVVAYRASWLSHVQYRFMTRRDTKVRRIALPNILAQADIVPELLQDDATPAALAAAVSPLLCDSPTRAAQLAAFATIRDSLGTPGAVARTAQMILDLTRSYP
jgi:lipid-A-disaccharide synthase